MFNVVQILLIISILVQTCHSNDLKNQIAKVRIIGGTVCSIELHPFMVSLQTENDDHRCGGSLLTRIWILTAAHCIQHFITKVVVGRDTPSEQRRRIFERHPHPSFVDYVDDIGLLKIDRPITTSEYVSLVSIPKAEFGVDIVQVCSVGLIMGWGTLSEEVIQASPELMCVELPIISNSSCARYRRGKYPRTMCTISAKSKNVCFGDSGGPLICKETGLQLGIVSFGVIPCSANNSPIIYTRVDKNLLFILETLTYRHDKSYSTKYNSLDTIIISHISYFIINRYLTNIN